MGPIFSIADFLDMVRRRLGLITLVVFLGCIASVIFALTRPHLFQSSEVIQVEQPKIAEDYSPQIVDQSVARRLQLIEQQVMARGSLQNIIDRYGLYRDLGGLTPSEKIHLLRTSISITGVAAPTEGFGSDGAISILTITATMGSPELAQQIAHEIANRTRKLAAAQRREQTLETLAFFEQQEERLAEDLQELESELAAFRTANNLSIDGTLEFRRSELASLNEALLDLDREIIAAELARSRIDRSARAATVQRLEAEADAEMESLTTQRTLLRERRDALSASLETSPEVERALADFERRRTQIETQLTDVISRRTDAEVGYSLEAGNRGERLITLEEASLPDYPITRSRKILAAMGGVASVFLALGLAFLMELRKPVIRTSSQMARETGLTPIVAIPTIRASRKRKGLSGFWQDRSNMGREGREARLQRRLSQLD